MNIKSDPNIPTITLKDTTFILDIINISDSYTHSIAVHEYPKSEKNLLEHMGPNTQFINVLTAWNNLSVDSGSRSPTFENHYNFINLVKKYPLELASFTHPQYGENKGYISAVSLMHDDRKEYVEISFDFIVSNPLPIEISNTDVKNSTGKNAVDDVLRNLADIAKSYKEAISQPTWIAQANLAINKFKTFYRTMTSPPDSILSMVYFSEDVNDQVVYEACSAVDRLVGGVQDTITAPRQMTLTMIQGLRVMAADVTSSGLEPVFINMLWSVGASRILYESAVLLETDSITADQQISQENLPSFDIFGKAIPLNPFVISMTIDDLDALSYDVRDLADEAVQIDRSNTRLKDQARSIQEYINYIKLNRDKIYVQDVSLQPLHLLVTQNGMSYKRAEQILKLNSWIHNPNFVMGSTRLLKKV